MTVLLLVFGLLGDCLLSVLVGLVGARRRIGFGWSFLLSVLLTPLIGLILTLLSEQLPQQGERRWGCLGTLLAIVALLLIGFVALLVFGLIVL